MTDFNDNEDFEGGDTFPIPPSVRRYIYGIVLAAAPLMIALGVTDNQTAGLVIGVVAAVLGGGVALPNVSK
jgi:hypothetical protein